MADDERGRDDPAPDANAGGLVARTCGAIADIDGEIWDGLANPDPARANPFCAHAFLAAIEASGSVGDGTGWAPRHLILEADGNIVGAAPMYAKAHSQGEYIFDHAFADAYMRAGGRYYPKLLIASPFSPVTGPRLLAPPEHRPIVATAATQLAQSAGVSSLHVNFAEKDDWEMLGRQGFLKRIDHQHHWVDKGYQSFDGFLEALSSRKRKNLKKERAAALEDGINVRWVSGDEITEADWDAFWEFYQDTGARKWGTPYLTREFFSLMGETMAETVVLMFAERAGQSIAGALHLRGGEALYGRYWGCTEHVPFLHFELCYYQAIDYALAHGLKRVEAGAQGEHKIARGYTPTPVYSAHWFADEGFNAAVARYLEAERRQASEDIDYLKDFTPFRKDG